MCDDTNCGKCSTDKATCTECNDGFGLDGATCAGKFLILGNYLLPTIHFNVVVLLVYELGVDITTCAGKFLMLRYGLFPTIYDNKVLHGFCADGTSYGSTFIIEQIFNLFSIIYCTVVCVLVVVVVVVYAVVMGVIEVGIVPT